MKEISIDGKKHVIYSSKVKKLVLAQLSKSYDTDKVNNVWSDIEKQYMSYLKNLPYLGGKTCRHNGEGGTYDTILLCSYYTIEKENGNFKDLAIAIKTLNTMANSLFVPSFRRMGKILNANSLFARKVLHFAFSITSKTDKKIEKKGGVGYIMDVKPLATDTVSYVFKTCPIAEFAKKNNLLEIMPSFCNGDYEALKMIHAHLIRRYTCANGPYCDFIITGDKSAKAKTHPMKIDDKGYIYNEPL